MEVEYARIRTRGYPDSMGSLLAVLFVGLPAVEQTDQMCGHFALHVAMGMSCRGALRHNTDPAVEIF